MSQATTGAGAELHSRFGRIARKTVALLLGLNAHERQTIYRAKADRLNTWNRRDSMLNCTQDGCSGVRNVFFHLL